MNIKKQLNKIRDYVEALEELSDKTHNELLQYQLAAHKFVKFESPDHIAREEFKALLGDTTFICGDFVVKYDGDAWDSLVPAWKGVSHDESYNNLIEENARLREALKWHPVSELPPLQRDCKTVSVDVIMKQHGDDEDYPPVIAYYSFYANAWICRLSLGELEIMHNSKWCYIPEDKDGE